MAAFLLPPFWVPFIPLPFSLLLLLHHLHLSNQLAFSVDRAAEASACAQSPNLKYCGEYQQQPLPSSQRHASKTIILASVQRMESEPSESPERDQAACRELKPEYMNTCGQDVSGEVGEKSRDDEFCAAYENVCYGWENNELVEKDDAGDSTTSLRQNKGKKGGGNQAKSGRQNTSSSPADKSKSSNITKEEPTLPPPNSQPLENAAVRTLAPSKRDYSDFCDEYKQRFLYVCPDPLRFGQRAAVFCPIYSERCRIPVPVKPVAPTPQPPIQGVQAPNMCGQYGGFAATYCGNPFAIQQNNVRRDATNTGNYAPIITNREGEQANITPPSNCAPFPQINNKTQ